MEYDDSLYKCTFCKTRPYTHALHTDEGCLVYDRVGTRHYITVEDIPAVKCPNERCGVYRYSVHTNRINYTRAYNLLTSLIGDILLNSNIFMPWESMLGIAILASRDSQKQKLFMILDSLGIDYCP